MMTEANEQKWREEFEAWLGGLNEMQLANISFYVDEAYLAACKKRQEEIDLHEKTFSKVMMANDKAETLITTLRAENESIKASAERLEQSQWEKFAEYDSQLEALKKDYRKLADDNQKLVAENEALKKELDSIKDTPIYQKNDLLEKENERLKWFEIAYNKIIDDMPSVD